VVETKVVHLEKLHNFSIFFSFESIKTENIFVYGEAPRESRNHIKAPLLCFSPPLSPALLVEFIHHVRAAKWTPRAPSFGHPAVRPVYFRHHVPPASCGRATPPACHRQGTLAPPPRRASPPGR
jgi:hypothetical protein